MSGQLELNPTGLTRSQHNELSELMDEASDVTPQELLSEARAHLEAARSAHASNRMINLRLATAVVETIGRAIDQWGSVSALSRSWLIGAICYFSRSDDDEPDFSSPIGFEDDVEVLNACLRFAKLSDLCINVEDFDDV